MAIPVHLQQFKAAGIYRVVFDKSTIKGINSEILRLVVGYSEIGPFNIPVYVKSITDFKAIYGDISKKLEKRGIYFHRTAIQALQSGPVLCLNLKKFSGETVDGATISSAFNPSYEIIDSVKINVEDIYDTSRFWELSADNLINLKSADNVVMDQYINIATTNTKESSATYFIRKAAGNKVSQYNISVSDWYSDRTEEMPEYLMPFKNSKISDFFAEIYVFKGHFTADQVLSSSVLKNYFELATAMNENGEMHLVDENGNIIDNDSDTKPGLKLREHLTNAYGDSVDTLDALYTEPTANPLAHYIGTLIPYFKNKKGQYMSLDILFNGDIDVHNMMMSFNIDHLEEGLTTIDLSGRFAIKTEDNKSLKMIGTNISPEELTIGNLFNATAKTNLLGNADSKVVVDKPIIYNNIAKIVGIDGDLVKFAPKYELTTTKRRLSGELYVSAITFPTEETTVTDPDTNQTSTTPATPGTIELRQVGTNDKIMLQGFTGKDNFMKTIEKLHITLDKNGTPIDKKGPVWLDSTQPFLTLETPKNGEPYYSFTTEGPSEIISSITKIEQTQNPSGYDYTDLDTNMSVSIETVEVSIMSQLSSDDSVYGSSVSFIPAEGYTFTNNAPGAKGQYALVADNPYEINLGSILQKGDCLLADDGTTDMDANGEADEKDFFYDNVYVQDIYKTFKEDNNGDPTDEEIFVIVLSGQPMTYESGDKSYYIRIDGGINQEVGTMMPQYLEGYVYRNSKPEGTDMMSKLNWQKFILSALTEYKGLRTGLLNKSDIDYRYIVDTFESYVDSSLKNTLSFLAKEKQNAFAILNFPAVRTFVKCPYSAYTDARGVFNVDYIVKGFNKKKPSGVKFSLPEDSEGASFCAFYTPLKFSDGYLDMIVPAAGLVSNLFMEKYKSRQPYYIIAGPNYGAITANGLVGPDYNYSQDELQLIEPFGVNCMIYRPGFGTFINANQTAKQTPVSALSKVNVRELVIYIQDEIEKVLQAYQWEFNNPTTRNAIKAKADLICSRVAANGGIQKFLNVMDESNNTPDIIDNEMAVLSTHIEPGMGCGKMVQELTLYRTGGMSAAISD